MNIFIAGLNYNMSEAELGELFAEYGEVVSVKIIMDRETGRFCLLLLSVQYVTLHTVL